MSRWSRAGSSLIAGLAFAALCSNIAHAAMSSEKANMLSGTPDLLVVTQGFYEHVDEIGLIGMVTAVEGNVATFMTCNGPMVKYHVDRLKATKLDCEDSASPDTNPMAGNCSDYNGAWTNMALVQSATSATPPSAAGIYSARGGNAGFESAKLERSEVDNLLAEIAVVMNCGGLFTGFDKAGVPVLNLYPADAAGADR
ncbi:hypothetical protein [Nitratireductor sp. GZWM139]|uniref:hypothetical protein n=1 Tax=Nitratireductor sp. GZWM139 TaxID=2950541 RepID=UPI0024BD9F24|nr:hypothetical protein [Nitratireductor sp. GZWM139]MDJ1463415.1 hypothetical protein [Nitratireductor sp. GZWM139]